MKDKKEQIMTIFLDNIAFNSPSRWEMRLCKLLMAIAAFAADPEGPRLKILELVSSSVLRHWPIDKAFMDSFLRFLEFLGFKPDE
jgi:hypothetical protein